MSILGAAEPLPYRPHRVLIGGTSGSGKTTLAKALARTLDLPYTEIDALHHGANWTVRPTFAADVEALARQQRWITDYQYAAARPILLSACDLVVYLALPRSVAMRRVIARTIRRSWHREVLWNGNVEPPLRTIFSDRDHIIRWAWRTHSFGLERIAEIASDRPSLPLVVLRRPRDVELWLERLGQTPSTQQQ